MARHINFNPQSAKSLRERFNEKVNRDGPIPPHKPELGPCEVWTGSHDVFGYGTLNIGDRDADGKYKPKLVKAHRLAWFLEHGVWPARGCALHRCDNPECVRISHLFNGNRPDNNDDRLQKDGYATQAKGERVFNHKLTEAQVREIRAICVPGIAWHASANSYSDLARKYGVTYSAIRLVVLRKNWKHVV